MNLDLTEEQEMLMTAARDFLAKECPKSLVRQLEESEKGYSPELWRKMAELGWMGLVLPEEYGGMGMGFMDLIILLQEMGRNFTYAPSARDFLAANPSSTDARPSTPPTEGVLSSRRQRINSSISAR